MKNLPEIKWDQRNLKRKDWYLSTALFLSGLLVVWMAILFNQYGIVLGLLGSGLLIASPVNLYTVGRRIVRIELTAQEQVLFDTSASGAKFRQSLRNVTD